MQTGILNKVSVRRVRTGLLAALAALSLAGCGGGGGGGAAPASVSGRVHKATDGTAPNPAATVAIGGVSGASSTSDGSFTLAGVSSSATTLTATATGAQTLNLPITLQANQNNNIGDIFLSDTGYTAVVTGRVVTSVNGASQPVGNATVVLAGLTVKTGTDGKFTLSNLPVNLGNSNVTFKAGMITAAGFVEKDLTTDTSLFPLAAGNNAWGDVLIGTDTGGTPLPAYTIKVTVKVNGTATAGLSVSLFAQAAGGGNGANLGPATDAGGGLYTFWVVPGTYNIQASVGGGSTQKVSVTLQKLDTPVTAPDINLTK
jgi:hypothetical protein